MYIPDFICGIVATIIVEIVAAVVWSIYDDRKNEHNRKEGKGEGCMEDGRDL